MSRPWMPLYVADYLADTAHLNAAQSGAYLHLIMHYWQKASLPDDDQALSRIARMTLAEWKRTRALVQPFFSNGWKHGRIEFELSEAARISAAARKGGEASARSRRDRSTVVQRSFNDQPNDPPTNGQPLQPQSQREEPSLRSGARKRASTLPDDWDPGPEGREFAKTNGLDAQKTGFEIQRFRDHAKAKGRTQKDWPAAWRNWVTSPYQSRASPSGFSSAPPRPGSKEDMRERSADAYRKLSEYVDANADEPGRSGGPREANVGLLPFAKPA